MALGFGRRGVFPVWVSVAIVLLLEVIPLLAIRDNLTLNILMLVAPNEAVNVWQAG